MVHPLEAMKIQLAIFIQKGRFVTSAKIGIKSIVSKKREHTRLLFYGAQSIAFLVKIPVEAGSSGSNWIQLNNQGFQMKPINALKSSCQGMWAKFCSVT